MEKYYPGKVAKLVGRGRHRVEYDDGDVEVLCMRNEIWRFCEESAERVVACILSSLKAGKPLGNV